MPYSILPITSLGGNYIATMNAFVTFVVCLLGKFVCIGFILSRNQKVLFDKLVRLFAVFTTLYLYESIFLHNNTNIYFYFLQTIAYIRRIVFDGLLQI